MTMEKTTKKSFDFATYWQKFGTVSILLLLLVVLAVAKPTAVFSATSIPQILRQSSVNILLALGEFFAILLGYIDLSISAACGLTGMVAALLMRAGFPWIPACLLGVLCGTLIGAANGFMINKTGLHPFIITLGMQTIYFGLMLVISNSASVYGFPAGFSGRFGAGRTVYILPPLPTSFSGRTGAVNCVFDAVGRAGAFGISFRRSITNRSPVALDTPHLSARLPPVGVPPNTASRRSHTIERKCCTSALVGRFPCLLFAVPPNTTASSAVPLRTSADIDALPFCFAAITRWKPSASQ